MLKVLTSIRSHPEELLFTKIVILQIFELIVLTKEITLSEMDF